MKNRHWIFDWSLEVSKLVLVGVLMYTNATSFDSTEGKTLLGALVGNVLLTLGQQRARSGDQ